MSTLPAIGVSRTDRGQKPEADSVHEPLAFHNKGPCLHMDKTTCRSMSILLSILFMAASSMLARMYSG